MKKSVLTILVLVTILAGCREGVGERKGPLHIVATTGIIEDGLKNIVGDSAEVSALMGPGTDPHLYKPTPFDMELLDEADVIVCNGLHLEGKMSEMLQKYGQRKPVIEVSSGIEKSRLIKAVEGSDAFDPHIWFNPGIWSDGLAHVTKELGEVEPNSAAYFQDNFEGYRKELAALESWVDTQLQTLDDSVKVLITSHDAFSYFGQRFDIEVRGIQGISTLSEVGLKDIADMVDFVIERQIPAIFVETSTSDKTAQSIVDGTYRRGFDLKLNGPLYSDALGEPDSPAGTYVGMVKENVRMIVEGLQENSMDHE
jgi:manganese/zinc/iron transport system substrate-binding protein